MLPWLRGWHGTAPSPHRDALGEVVIPHHVGDPQIFEGDGVVVAYQMERGLVVEVGALALHRLMRLAKPGDRFSAPLAALLAFGDAARRFGELLLTPAVVAWVLYHCTIRRAEEHLQPHVNAGLAPRRGKGLRRHVGAGADGVPAVRLLGEGDGLGCSLQRARPAHGDAANLGEDEETVIQPRAVVVLRIVNGEVNGEVKEW